MPADDVSSNDSAVIDDDLVQALGFEPAPSSALVEPIDDDIEITDDDISIDDGIDDVGVEADAVADVVAVTDTVIETEPGTDGDTETDTVEQAEAVFETELDEAAESDDATADVVTIDDLAEDDLVDGDLAVGDLAVGDLAVDDLDLDDGVDLTDEPIDGDAAAFADQLVGEVEAETDLFDVDVDGGLDELDGVGTELSESDLADAEADLADAGMLDLDTADADLEAEDPDADTADADTADDDAGDLDEVALDLTDAPDVDLTEGGLDLESTTDLDTDDLDTGALDADGDAVEVDGLLDLDPDAAGVAPSAFDETAFDETSVVDVADADATALVELDEADVELELAPDLDDASTALVGGAAAGAATAKAKTETSRRPKRQRRRKQVRARKARRVLRHVDPWSILTFSVLFHLAFFAAMLLASVLVWNAAIASGTLENIENFIKELGDYDTYEINGDVVFRAAVIIAGMLTLASSVMVVLLTVVFNLISDLIGGIRITVIEEETVRVPAEKTK